jgi:hypothetical protein
MSKLLFTTCAAAGLFLAGSSTEAQAGYVGYGCCSPAPVYGYSYAPAYVPVRTAVVPVVPVYPAPHYHHHHRHAGSGLQIRTPGFSFGYFR